jgi:hypothetical protein
MGEKLGLGQGLGVKALNLEGFRLGTHPGGHDGPWATPNASLGPSWHVGFWDPPKFGQVCRGAENLGARLSLDLVGLRGHLN